MTENAVPTERPEYPPVFRSEASMWDYLERGERHWEARRIDWGDERHLRLFTCTPGSPDNGLPERMIALENKLTRQILVFEISGVDPKWQPGWILIGLGRRVHELEQWCDLDCYRCVPRLSAAAADHGVQVPNTGLPCPEHAVRCGTYVHSNFEGRSEYCGEPAGHTAELSGSGHE